ncbi:MAG: DUF1080 domain-containing protein [Verrucomicrobiota bacterium]
MIKIHSVFALGCILSVSLIVSPVSAEEPELKPIFNGTDFTGWKLPDNNIWWKVENGEIVCQSGPKKKGSTLWTEKEYEDFIFETEFKFDGKGDSGIFLRTTKQQVQIGISGSLKRDMTGSMYIPGKGYPSEASGVKELLKINEWNVMKVVVKRATYDIFLNGKLVSTFTGQTPPKKGRIGLQLHGNKDMRIDFRNIKLAEL